MEKYPKIHGGQSEPLFSVICKEKPSLRSAVKHSPLGLVVKNEPLAHGEESELLLRCEERPRMGPLRLGGGDLSHLHEDLRKNCHEDKGHGVGR